jgi:hypothetical protein
MQSNKSKEKWRNFHYTPTSTTRNYYDEEIIDRDGPFIIYQLGNPVWTLLTGFFNWYQYCISQENFKRFYKLPKYDN